MAGWIYQPLLSGGAEQLSGGAAAQAPFVANESVLATPVQRRKQAGQTDVTANLLTTTLAVAVTLVARDPLYTQRPQLRQVQPPQTYANLNLTTLAPVVQAPLRPVDFGNPVRRAATIQDTSRGSFANRLLPPFSNEPTEQLTARRAAQQIDWLNLQATTLAVAPAPPITPILFDNPVRRVPSLTPYSVESVSYYTETPVQPIDWQNPTRIKVAQQPDGVPNLVLTTLFTTPPDPFRQSDWPNPVLARQVQQPTPQTGLLQTSLYVEPPTLVARGPLFAPIFKAGKAQQLDWINLQTTTLAPTGVQAPFTPVLFDNPIFRRHGLSAHALDSASYYAEIPFSQLDWPNPVLRKPVQQPTPQTGLLQTSLFTTPPTPPPGLNFDFPNPVLARAYQDDTSQGQNPEFIVPPVIPPVVTPPVGGDDRPDPKHQGWDRKKAKLKLTQEQELAADIRRLYRKLTDTEETREAAEAIVAEIVAPTVQLSDDSRQRTEQLKRSMASLAAQLSVEKEIALRLLHADLMRQEMERDDWEAIQITLGLV